MYQRILVPLDGSMTAEKGLQEAIRLASGQKTQLVLLHILDDYPLLVELASTIDYEKFVKDLRKYGQDLLSKAKAAAGEASVDSESFLYEATGKRVSDVIIDQAREHACDLIVMGTHGRRGFSRWTLGSEAERVVRSSTVPVLLVRAAPEQAATTP